MDETRPLLIVGASTRAAAFSALRAGLTPWCADLFADADLQARCAVWPIPAKDYPRRFPDVLGRELPGPWMYTGALENWPLLVEAMRRRRPLWGNDKEALFLARSPWHVQDVLRRADLPSVAAWRWDATEPPVEGRWLRKPLRGAGGVGIRRWKTQRSLRPHDYQYYLQRFVEGESWAAVYAGNGATARLLGATRQLVGESWLHARPFRYCGSLGPLVLPGLLHETLERIGKALAAGCRLHGLFGVDCVLQEGVPFPVEINPRYTASVEVLEYAVSVQALAHHRQVFDPSAPPADDILPVEADHCVGKAILFAKAPLVFPADGPWLRDLRSPRPVMELPGFADIPHAGERIEAGRPVLTFFARAASADSCLDELRRIAADLDQHLFGK